MFGYSNNGNTMRAVEANWTPMDGEVFFDHRLAEDELLVAFPGRAAALAAEALDRTRKTLISRIEELEAKQHRAVREAMLTGDKARLQTIEDQIVLLRSELA